MKIIPHRFAPSFGKLHLAAPCFPLSAVSSGVCDSEVAIKEQSAANVFMLLQRGPLGRLTQIQIAMAPIIFSWQEGWTNDLIGLSHLEYL